jgi:PAS domain S-box-containing protein
MHSPINYLMESAPWKSVVSSKKILEALRIAVITTDLQGNILSLNTAAKLLFSCQDLVHPKPLLYNLITGIGNYTDAGDIAKSLEERKDFCGQVDCRNLKHESFPALLDMRVINTKRKPGSAVFAFFPLNNSNLSLTINDEKEAKINSIYRAAPVGIGIIVNRIIQDVNEYFCQMVGFTRAQLIGRSGRLFYLDEQSLENLGSDFFPNFSNTITKSIETRFKRNDGRTIHVLLSVTPLFENDRSKGITFTVIDITDRKNAEKQLQLSHETYAGIINSVREAIYILDEKGCFLDMNDTALKFFGYSREEITGRTANFFLARGKNYLREYQEKFNLALGGESSLIELWGRRKDGSIFPNEVSLSKGVYFGEKAVIAVARDISERKQSEESLRESNARLTNVMNSIEALIYVVDMETYEILFLNDHGRKELGDVAGKICWQALQEGQTGPCGFCTNHLLIKRDGTPAEPYLWEFQNSITGRWYDCRDQAIPWNDGRLVRLEVATDITARKMAEEALRFELGFKEMVADVSSRFVNMTHENSDELVNYSLKLSGEFFDVDRCFIFLFTSDGLYMNNSHEWCASDIEPQKDNLQGLPINLVPWWVSRIRKHEHIHIPDVKALTEEAAAEKAILEGQDIKSVLVIPMVVDGESIGFYGYDSVKKQKVWSEDQISLLKVLTEIVSGGFGKQQARQALVESQMQLSRAQQIGHIGSWTYRLDIQKLRASEEAHHIFGLPPNLSFSFQDVMSQVLPENRSLLYDAIRNVESFTSVFEEEFRIERKNDKEIRVIYVVAEYDKERNSLFGMIQDVTERKKANEALMESENLFRTLVENAFDGIYMMNDRRFVYINERFSQIVGYEPEEITSPDFDLNNLLTESSRNLVQKRYDDRKNEVVLPSSYEMQILSKSGEIKEVELSTVVLKAGENPNILGVMRDITYRKQHQSLEQEVAVAKKSAQFKQNFLANMSHEIRTPITGIIGMAEILSKTPLSAIQLEYLNTLKISTENLREIINQILDYSKIEAGQMQIKNRVFPTRNLILNARKVFESICSKDLKFITHIDAEVPDYVEADEPRINQVINNFLSNAVKFTSQGSITLRIKLESPPAEGIMILKAEVEDTGPGIHQKLQRQLFRPFSQLDQIDQREIEGTGLGLSISKELAHMMGGKIGVISEPGQGSLFWFSLKAGCIDPGVNTVFETVKQRETFNKQLSILVVEDKVVNQKVISLMLNALGHQVTLAGNGQEALDIFPDGKFDLILMDIQMPVMDGITATQILKEKYDDLPPVVGLSANAFEGDREKYMDKGMDDYLTKPVQGDDFARLLDKFFYE